MISRDEIRERGRLICCRLAEDVAKLTPEGIGRWERTWQLVSPADAAFMVALSAWECDASNRAMQDAVRSAYAAVLDAWRAAVSEYEGAGR